MTAVTLPDLDLARIRAAVDRLDLPSVDLPHVDLDRLDHDLSRLRAAVEDVDLPHVDLRHVDLPVISLSAMLGRSRRPLPLLRPGVIAAGVAALAAGVMLGALAAFFLHPSKGARRRRGVRRRIGRVVRRVLP